MISGDTWIGQSVLLLLLDLTVVFDMVSYNPMTHCLTTTLHWLISFLHGQGFSVFPLVYSIPQRVILSPIVFIVYMHSLAQLILGLGWAVSSLMTPIYIC